MTLSTLFEKQVFVRLSEDHTAFICTTKWPLLSRTRRVGVHEAGRDFAPQVGETGPIAPEELPVLRAQRYRTKLDSPNARVREADSRVVAYVRDGLNTLRWRDYYAEDCSWII
jgi:hypothetical protein